MMEVQKGKTMQLQMQIYSPCSTIGLDIRTGAIIDVNGSIDGIPVVSVVGGKDLSKNYSEKKQIWKRLVDNRYPSRDKRRTQLVFDREVTGFENVALNMSVIYPCTTEEAKNLIEPFMQQGVQRIYIYTLANSRHLPNSFCVERWGFQNKWIASGSPPDSENFDFINSMLREKKSNLRIRTPNLFVTRVLSENV